MKGDKDPPARPKSLALLSDEPLADVVRYVQLAYNPSVHAYHTLKSQIELASPRWLSHFLELGGFDAFLDTLHQLAGHKFTNFSDAVLQLDCLSCVKAVLNTAVGMQYFIQYEDAINKLLTAIDTPNTLPKKQILELLTAVAMFSKQGHDRLLLALDQYKQEKNLEHMFSAIVSELKNSETATYRVTLMSLINVILRGHIEVKDRARVRAQFIALRLLDVMTYIRKDDREPELAIQFEVFDSDKHLDDQLLLSIHGLDITCHSDLFQAVHNKIFCTPSDGYFLHILQDLYHLESTSCAHHSEEKWSAIAKVVNMIVKMKGDTECREFLNNLPKIGGSADITDFSYQRFTRLDSKSTLTEHRVNPRSHESHNKYDSETCKFIVSPEAGESKADSVSALSGYSEGSAEKRSQMSSGTARDVNRQDSGISITSHYDNMPSIDGAFSRRSSGRNSFGVQEKLRDRAIKPQKPVKVVRWSPVKDRDAYKPLSIWKIIQEKSHKPQIALNYKSLEDEFSADQTSDGVTDAGDEVHLLEPEESLKLNLLLARLEAMPEELADSVLQCDPSDLNPSSMDLILAAIPPEHQLKRVRNYTGPRFTLSPAEQFLAFMCENQNYAILLAGLKFKVNFIAQFPKLKTAFEAMISSCRDVLHHFGLRDFIKVILEAGNFLNSGNDLEPVAGIKLKSWKSLAEVKGQDHHSNLLDFLVRHIELADEDILMFVNDFPGLEKATRYSLDDMKKEVTELNLQMKTLLHQLSQAHYSVKDSFHEFVEEVKSELAGLHGNIARLKGLSSQMALYFCEDEVNFDLRACLKSVMDFIVLVKNCRKDGCLLRDQKAAATKRQADLKKKIEDDHIMKFFGKKADLCSSFARAQTDPLVDYILGEVHRGVIAYHQEEEPKTPDSDNQMFISAIPRLISTPVDNLDVDLESDSFIFQQGAGNQTRRTYVDKVEAIVDKKYHREKQMESGSFLNQGKQKQDVGPVSFNPVSSKDFQIKIYPKLSTEITNPPVPVGRLQHQRHKRTCSDLETSRVIDKKWVAYENDLSSIAAKQRPHEDNMESKKMIMSLGLEKNGKILKDVDIEAESERNKENKTPDSDKPAHYKKKRVSLFQRFSQAVLRQRSANVMEEVKGQGYKGSEPVMSKDLIRNSKRWSGRSRKSKKSIDKENIRMDGHTIEATEI